MLPGEQRRLCVENTHENVRKLALFARNCCSNVLSHDALDLVELAVVEAANNIVEHSYKSAGGKPVELNIIREYEQLKFSFVNLGAAFDLKKAPSPTFNWNSVGGIPESGRGLFLINSIMDEVSFFREGELNFLIMIKNIPPPTEDYPDYFPFINELSAGLKITKREMDIAIDLYKNLVPSKPPEIQGLALYSRTEPALLVGGDYLSFHKIDDDNIWFMACDAMGKGMSAAFFSLLVHMTFQSVLFIRGDVDPGELLTLTNKIMSKEFDRFGMFMTSLVGKVCVSDETLFYASAGHCPPILYSGQVVETLDTVDYMMGVDDTNEYTTHFRPFKRGMKLLVYTDGFTDIPDANGDMIGVDPLLYACAKEFKTKRLPEACEKIFTEALMASGERLQDDISLMGIECL